MATLKQRVHRYNGSSYDTVHYETEASIVTYSKSATSYSSPTNVQQALDDLYSKTSSDSMSDTIINNLANSSLNTSNITISGNTITNYFTIVTSSGTADFGTAAVVGAYKEYTLEVNQYEGFILTGGIYATNAYSQSGSGYSYANNITVKVDIDDYSTTNAITIPNNANSTYFYNFPCAYNLIEGNRFTIRFTITGVYTGKTFDIRPLHMFTGFSKISKKTELPIYP